MFSKFRKYIVSGVLSSIFAFSSFTYASDYFMNQESIQNIYLNQQIMVTSGENSIQQTHMLSLPVNLNGTIMLDAVTIRIALNATNVYNATTNEFTMTKGNDILIYKLGSKEAKFNGVSYQMPEAVQRLNGYTMVPIEFFSKIFGYTYVSYPNQQRLMIIPKDEDGIIAISNYKTLTLNTQGNAVVELQTRLKSLGYYNFGINGTYDSNTKSAVLKYQQTLGLSPTGDTDEVTFKSIFPDILDHYAGLLPDIYTVLSGDSLWTISLKTGLTMEQIISYNNMDPNSLIPGQRIHLKAPVIQSIASRDVNKYHVLSDGETLSSIATKYGITTNTLKSLNFFTTNSTYIGQVFNVGSTKIDGFLYTVREGDSLFYLSNKYGVSLDTLKKLNTLNNDEIYVGQELFFPYANTIIESAPSKPSSVKEWPSLTYVVQSGDSVSGVAKKFGVKINDIIKYNYLGINRNTGDIEWLNVGQLISINGFAPRNFDIVFGEDQNEIKSVGKYISWYRDGQHLINRDDVFSVTDFYTGITFNLKMYAGMAHIDIEPLTLEDTNKMKQAFGSNWGTWRSRPVIIRKDGMNIAGALATSWHGTSSIQNNGVTGHADLYLGDSHSHDPYAAKPYQAEFLNNVRIAAGLKILGTSLQDTTPFPHLNKRDADKVDYFSTYKTK